MQHELILRLDDRYKESFQGPMGWEPDLLLKATWCLLVRGLPPFSDNPLKDATKTGNPRLKTVPVRFAVIDEHPPFPSSAAGNER